MIKMKSGEQPKLGNRILVVILVFLLFNTLLIGFGYFIFFNRLTATDYMFAYKQEMARDISDYSVRLAADLDVHNLPEVREALAEYNYALDLAVGSEELIQVILNQGRRLQDVIFEAADSRVKEKILEAVNNDPRIQETSDRTHLYIRVSDNTITLVPDHLLDTNTLQRVTNILLTGSGRGNRTMDLEIEGGTARLILPQTPEEQLLALTDDLNSTRMRLHEVRVQAGLAEMVGPGITLYVYDAVEPEASESIVHDADIRDLVNELFSAGARGISVGGERLITSSPIRCSGPLIMVNYRQIVTNPVVIEAVGDPELLISGLNIIVNELENKRGLNFEVNHSGFLKLPAYTRAN